MITCKLLCVLYVAVVSVLMLVGGSNGNVRALPDVSVLYEGVSNKFCPRVVPV